MNISLSYSENGKTHELKGTSEEVRNSFANKGCRIWNGTVKSKLGERFFIKYIMSEYNSEDFHSRKFYEAAKQRFYKEEQCLFRYPFLTYVYCLTEADVTDEATGEKYRVLCLIEEYNGDTTLADFYSEETEENKNKKTVFSHMLQLLYGLEYYSKCKKPDGIIHRDLKPSNIMLKDGCIKYIDFDWCHVDDDMGTRHDGDPIFGTEEFAHPRQMMENQDSFIGMDIYSLGLIFIYMLSHIVYTKELKKSNIWQNTEDKQKSKQKSVIWHCLYRSIIGDNIDDELASIIAKMIADQKSQYKNARDIIIDFEDYLKKQYMYDEIIEDMYTKYHLLPRENKMKDKSYIISVSVFEKDYDICKERMIDKIRTGESKSFHNLGDRSGNSVKVFCAGDEMYIIIENEDEKNIQWNLSNNESSSYQAYSGNWVFEFKFELLNQ